MPPRFNIGDRVWVAAYGNVAARITCPVCYGNRAVTLILGNGDEVRLPCGHCSPGYESPRGYVTEYRAEARAYERVIDSVTVSTGAVEYGAENYSFPEARAFATEAEALAAAEQIAAEAQQANERRADFGKEDAKRSFAWNAGYHLRESKRLREKADYHDRMAVLCKRKGAEEKAAPTPSPAAPSGKE
jgi:hypothetical protein